MSLHRDNTIGLAPTSISWTVRLRVDCHEMGTGIDHQRDVHLVQEQSCSCIRIHGNIKLQLHMDSASYIVMFMLSSS